MTYQCFKCDSTEDVELYIVQFVDGSPGVIRPICRKCREAEKAEATK